MDTTKTTSPQTDEFITKDLHFAAFLKLCNVQLIRLEKHDPQNDFNPRPVYFVFLDKPKCDYLESVFWGGQGAEVMVNVKDYVATTRDLRARTATVNSVHDVPVK